MATSLSRLSDLAQQPAAAAPAKPVAPWKTYQEFHAGNPEALKFGHYLSGGGIKDSNIGTQWGSKNPWAGRNEYNQYLQTLPKEYQTLIGAGIAPEMVTSGKAKRVWMDNKLVDIPLPGETAAQTAGRIGGTGSSFSLNPSILNKMWR